LIGAVLGGEDPVLGAPGVVLDGERLILGADGCVIVQYFATAIRFLTF
jgi:hypothetical protein